MSKEEQAGLILKLYELRREEVMRTARDWFFREFNPQSVQEMMTIVMGPHGGHMRMIPSYWEMAAALVNQGAIDLELFNETNGEHFGVFAKLEPFLDELRATFNNPKFLHNLEKLVDATPDGRKISADFRERQKKMLEMMAASKASAK
jgi:hypothetical protein